MSRELAKRDGEALGKFIRDTQGCESKMIVLRSLEGQMDLLMESGRTSPTGLRHELEIHAVLKPLPEPPDLKDQISSLQASMREVAPHGELAVKGKGREFTFQIDSLARLRSPDWLNDELILLCLHLSQKHRYVRVGFSVPLHQQTNGTNLMAKPFERAAGQIDQWRATKPGIVCFFPLNQRNNHFSLLEVDCKRDTIHHYDSLEEGPDAEVQV